VTWIATVAPGRAGQEAARAYRYLEEVMGSERVVARVVQAFSLRPASMLRMVRSWDIAMWRGREPRASRELLAAAVSRLNDCHY
jgi:hypothetical protein